MRMVAKITQVRQRGDTVLWVEAVNVSQFKYGILGLQSFEVPSTEKSRDAYRIGREIVITIKPK